jgi:hypothetical protein
MCYSKEIIVETTICINKVFDHYPSIANNNKKIAKRLHNEDVIGKLEIKNWVGTINNAS